MADQPTDPNEQDPNASDHPSSGSDPESTGEQAESAADGAAPGSESDPSDAGSDEHGESVESGESSSSPETTAAPSMSDAAASLLAAAKAAVSKASAPQQQPADDPAGSTISDSGGDGDVGEMSNDDIAALMAQAEQQSQATPQVSASVGPSADGATPFEPPVLDIDTDASDPGTIDLLAEVHLNVQIELGRTRMLIEDVLSLGDGAVVELDKLAGDPVDVYVNDRLIARGEVLVLNDNFCVRISEICDAEAAGARSQSA